ATHSSLTHDSFTSRFAQGVSLNDVEQAILDLRSQRVADWMPVVDERAIQGLKFADCLPAKLALHALQTRMREDGAVKQLLVERIRIIST
ncbi:MAG: hypothetical protein ACREHD_23825, partial [Pirellulales bacterium]